jgi:hypothetical protein
LNDQSRHAEPNDPRVEAALRDYLERVDRGEPVDCRHSRYNRGMSEKKRVLAWYWLSVGAAIASWTVWKTGVPTRLALVGATAYCCLCVVGAFWVALRRRRIHFARLLRQTANLWGKRFF